MSSKSSYSVAEALTSVDPVWSEVQRDANLIIKAEPAMASFVFATVLSHSRLEDAIVHRIAQRLDSPVVSAEVIRCAFEDALADDASIGEAMRVDIAAVYDRDPACSRTIEPLLYFKGFHAVEAHRLAHWLWEKHRNDLALYLQSRSSEVFQTDINPAVPMGKGIFLDHATGLVVGQTAVIGNDVSILQDVTLGGTGKETGDRHPKIGNGVLIGAGAKILGNITIGDCSKVAAGSVVLKPVPAHSTVAGVPARVIGVAGCKEPARSMDQIFAEDDRTG
ncbi:MAG: serine O-acetyltransferase [Bauldia sp.]|nr:MAG: serine O-acetyltransferase [Bauldia sp.]MBZ0229439.1 serine O-acetyltransferase [Bauldia sp.]